MIYVVSGLCYVALMRLARPLRIFCANYFVRNVAKVLELCVLSKRIHVVLVSVSRRVSYAS